MNGLIQAQEKMRDGGATQLAIDVFSAYYDQLASGVTGLIPEDTITPITETPSIEDIEIDPQVCADAMAKTVIIKLNGGLGTSMGMDRAKSLLPVRGGKTFLDIIVDQVRHARDTYGVTLPLMLMNSFRTRESLDHLPADIAVDGLPADFLQGREPKLRCDDLTPVTWPADPSLEWCPPGHGDIFTTLMDQGIVDKLLEKGYRYLATSNADNLGASPDPKIAGWFAQSGAPYAPEVCIRTAADRKGGHLAIRNSDGRVILRDTAQTPEADMHYFTDEFRHRFFHTNNLWFNLEALHDLLEETGGVVGLPLIRNKKTVDPTDASSPEVYQIECAIGAIVERFDGATPIVVPRDRFLPVKTTNDLLTLRSDAYELVDGRLELQSEAAPIVDLDPHYYKTMADFDARFEVVPSLKNARTFTVRGDHRFTEPAEFAGDVTIEEIA